jgi:ferredoxin/flavodoxin---NADP+ reductase
VASGFKVAVVGAGPSGFYTAGALLRGYPAVEVSLIERLATPYGLVRYGVAPDHPSLKSVTAIFERIGCDPRVHYFGNTALWRDVSMEELRATHHAVVLAIGAPADRCLNLASRPQLHTYAASQIVGWYNGHPDYAHFTPHFGAGRVCIFGHGNVAVDLARMLLCPPDALAHTDISQRSLQLLGETRIREVHLVGRRGPAETRFSAPAIAELLELPGVGTVIDTAVPTQPNGADTDTVPAVPLAAREVIRVVEAAANRAKTECNRQVVLHYYSTPEAIESLDNGLEVHLARGPGADRASRRLRVDATISAIGYELTSSHCNRLPVRGGVLSNQSGRMHDANDATTEGLYAVGWAARGANGTIGTCRSEAERLTRLILADAHSSGDRAATGSEGLRQILSSKQHRYVSFEEWRRLDAIELASGAAAGRSRLKFQTLTDMLSSLDLSSAKVFHRAITHD